MILIITTEVIKLVMKVTSIHYSRQNRNSNDNNNIGDINEDGGHDGDNKDNNHYIII